MAGRLFWRQPLPYSKRPSVRPRRVRFKSISGRRISAMLASRWRREFDLERSVPNLVAHEAEYARDFAEFFPQLQAHVTSPTAIQESS